MPSHSILPVFFEKLSAWVRVQSTLQLKKIEKNILQQITIRLIHMYIVLI